jgi:hypothetical protein
MRGHRDKCRRFATEHLVYEVEQLHGLIVKFLEIRAHDDDHGDRDLEFLDMATRNAQVESFAIHTRALLDFLYGVRRQPTDAIASDFVPRGWNAGSKPKILDSVKPRVGSEIAHMSYRRVGLTDAERQWHYLEVWDALAATLTRFANDASADLLPRKVSQSILRLAAAPRLPVQPPGSFATPATATNALPGPGTATHRPEPSEEPAWTFDL